MLTMLTFKPTLPGLARGSKHIKLTDFICATQYTVQTACVEFPKESLAALKAGKTPGP